MYAIVFNESGRLALRVADYITAADYIDLRPLLDTALHRSATACLYWEMDYFRGWKPDELWKDLQFDLTVTADFARIALVGTEDNLSTIRPVMEAIFRAEIRGFTVAEKQAAWDWFMDGSITPSDRDQT